MVERFVRPGATPAQDPDIREHGGIPGPDVRKEGVQGVGVFDCEGIGAVEYGLRFSMDLVVQDKEAGHECRGGDGIRVGIRVRVRVRRS